MGVEVRKSPKWDEYCSRHETLIRNFPSLPCATFKPGSYLYDNVRNMTVSNLFPAEADALTLTKDNFSYRMKQLLSVEEIYEAIELRKFDMTNKLLKKVPDPRYREPFVLELVIPELSNGEPSLIPGDFVILESDDTRERCAVADIDGDRLLIGRAPSRKRGRGATSLANSYSIEYTPVNLSFVKSGFNYKEFHARLDKVEQSQLLRDALFESPTEAAPLKADQINVESTATDQLNKRLAALNERQRQAVLGILRHRCRPHPYILFGPPGTGKTTTLVESIVQVYCRDPTAQILVCVNSNNCADQLAEMLDQTGLVSSMRRFVSRRHHKERAAPCRYDVLKWEYAYTRVVVTTNNKSANLTGHFKYKYVFIDEASHAHEPELLTPVLNLQDDGLLVLAGDPKQLGPVVQCRELESFGLARSTLERLFNLKIYARDETTGQYDENYIAKLILSYRCDPRILKLCSELFYHGELECLGRTPDELLKSLNFNHPLVFHPVAGIEHRPEFSTSKSNTMEADQCVDYVMRLLSKGIAADKIGVITNYQLQKLLLREKLSERMRANKALHDQLGCKCLDNAGNQANLNPRDRILDPAQCRAMCRVNTIDSFQGQEREIIIISTVRSPITSGGDDESSLISESRFLTDSRRFNVAISRAKWLVIVVGHPEVIGCHDNWKKFGQLAEYAKAKTDAAA